MITLINNSTMVYKNEHVELSKNYERGINYLIFQFKGKFTEEASVGAAKAWDDITRTNPSDSFVLIWNCNEMTGFEQGAKNAWMQSLKNNENQTDDILLISENIIIRGAARLMSKLASFNLSVFKSDLQLESWMNDKSAVPALA